MIWATVILKLKGFVKEIVSAFKWQMKSLKNDKYAQGSFCVMLILLLVGVYGWWLYWTKPVRTVEVEKITTKEVIKWKPYLGGTVNPHGPTKLDMCMIPKVGCALVVGKRFTPALTIRFIHYKAVGMEFGACTQGPMAGLDFQMPFLNTLTVSGGICPNLENGVLFRPYIAGAVAARY